MKDGRKEIYQIKFEELLENFDENDSISIEDASDEMHKHWLDYVDAGCDAEVIVKMMSPIDVFKNYDLIVSRGINLDGSNLINRIEAFLHSNPGESEELFKENFSWFSDHGLLAVALPVLITDSFHRKEFIFDHVEEIKDRVDQATLSTIIIDCYDDVGMEFDSDLFEEYHNTGLDMSLLAKYALRHGFDDYRISDELLIEILDSFYEAGVPKDLIRQLLKSLSGFFFYDVFFESNQIDWLMMLDDDLSPYIDKIINDECFEDYDDRAYSNLITELPKEIHKLFFERILNETSIRDLDIGIVDTYGSLEECLKDTGLDVDLLVDKFVKEDGYTNCCDDWLPLHLFKLAPTKLDPEKIVQKVLDDKGEDPEDLERIFNELKELGVDEAIIAPLLETN